ncbi:MAG: AAA family ATPase, partial [Chloroflexi bacterium]|nr:AAA family ATPase [Chloroflexota bacterium]
TDVAQTEHKIRAVRAGADDLQLRPVHDAELAARIRGLLVRFAPRQPVPERSTGGRIHAFYGAKGGVGSTTLAINSAIALHRGIGRRVALMDGNLQFGDHRVFLDLGSDRRSIIDVVSSSAIDQDVLRSLVVRHDTGIDLMLAPPTPESAELVNQDQHHVAQILGHLRDLYDYVVIDVDKRLDDTTLDVIGLADVLFVVMTADLSCLKNVRLVLETMKQLGVSQEKVQLVLNRSNAFTGINVKAAEGALRRRIDYQVVNDYRTAISALNSGAPFNAGRSDSALARAVLDFVRAVDKQNHAVAASTQLAPARL